MTSSLCGPHRARSRADARAGPRPRRCRGRCPRALRRRPLRRHPEGDRRPRPDRPCDGRGRALGPRRRPAPRAAAGGTRLSSGRSRRPARREDRRRGAGRRRGPEDRASQQPRPPLPRRGPGLADPVVGRIRRCASGRRRRCSSRATPAALPALDAALAKESDGRVRTAMEAARAAIVLGKADAPEAERVAAVAMLVERGDGDSAAMLRSLPADTPESVKSAAAAGVTQIEQQALAVGAPPRTSSTASASARCCSSPRSASPSPSARWASSTWPMARW